MKDHEASLSAPLLVFRECLEELWTAHRYAVSAGGSDWEFAVRRDELRDGAAGPSELRYLITRGWVAHGADTEDATNRQRAVRPRDSLVFDDLSCFTLTASGVEVCERLLAPRDSPGEFLAKTPVWDVARHELRYEGLVIKRFRCPAANQEAILAAFEEERWPRRIDDPLTPCASIDPKRRLGDTIKCLNRNQERTALRFKGDGTGEGVIWCSQGDHHQPAEELATPASGS